jgi:hypothetical protein
VEPASVAHARSTFRDGDNFTKRRHAVLSRHLTSLSRLDSAATW